MALNPKFKTQILSMCNDETLCTQVIPFLPYLDSITFLKTTIIMHIGIIGFALILYLALCAKYIYCYARFCVTQSVSPKVSESPNGPLVDYFLVLSPGLLPGVDR